jgi:hypothetical protein
MQAITNSSRAVRELAQRENDGLEVRLFWDARDDRLTVSVADSKSGEFFEFEVARDKALDGFYHPYSYAAFRLASSPDALLAA